MSFERDEIGMPKKQREHIKKNMDKLIRVTKYNELMNSCVRTNLLSSIMRKNIEKSQGNFHEQLLTKITKRGPDAFANLRKIFEEMNNIDALNILDELDGGGDDAAFQSIHNNKRDKVLSTRIAIDGCVMSTEKVDFPNLAPFNEVIQTKLKVIKSQQIKEVANVPIYTMKTKNRGVIFITNIIEALAQDRRNGAEFDSHALIDLFQQLGFTVYHYYNLEKYQFFKLLKDLLKSEEVRQTESFVLALMTHGTLNGGISKVAFSDGSIVPVEDILGLFQHSTCPHLLHKPKIMLFPFCRGTQPDSGVKYKSRSLETDGIGKACVQHFSSRSDTIICHASVLGFEAHRHPDEGSWYIQVFCKQMAEHAHSLDFESILKKVHEEVSQKRSEKDTLQTTSYENEGFKLLYFNPGV